MIVLGNEPPCTSQNNFSISFSLPISFINIILSLSNTNWISTRLLRCAQKILGIRKLHGEGCSFQLNANDKALGRYPHHPTYFQNIFLLKVPGFVIFICGNFCSMAGCLYFVAYSVHLFIFTPRFAARGKRKETCFFSTTTNQPQSKHEGEQRYPAPKQQRI